MKFNHIQYFLILTILFYSCGVEEEIDESSYSNETTFGIRHDRSLSEYETIAANSDPNKPDFSSVISFSYSLDGSSNHDYVASGVLIDSEWILTAGHNFYDTQSQNNPALVSGISVKVGNNPNNPDSIVTVSELVFHPTWLDGQQGIEHANDLCLVKLTVPITGITPAILFSTNSEQLNEEVWHCGFGVYSDQPGQDSNLDSNKHAIQNILDRIETGFETSVGGIIYSGGLLAFDFDNPSGTINSLGDDLVNEDESILGLGSSSPICLNFEGTTVTGDSGGPLFLKDNGVWKVVGILSGGAVDPINNYIDGDYGDISIYTQVSSVYNWINSTIN